MAHTGTLQPFEELVTMVRGIVDIRWLFTYAALRAVVVRAKADQIAKAEWMFNELAYESVLRGRTTVRFKIFKNLRR